VTLPGGITDPEYKRTVALVLERLKAALVRGVSLEFVMPPEDVFVAIDLAAYGCGERLARSVATSVLVRQLAEDGATIEMLRSALIVVGVPYENVSLESLGLNVRG
jgi:hypothetical protein